MNEKEYNNKRVPLIQKSLSIVLASLQGEEVKIELKDDSEMYGTIETVGHGMDMKLRNVGQKRSSNESLLSSANTNSFSKRGGDSGIQKNSAADGDGDDNDDNNDDDDDDFGKDNQGDDDGDFNNFDLDSTLLRGDSIRFVHIPPHINITNHLSQYMRRFESRNFKKIKIVDRRKLPQIAGDRVINMTSSSAESISDENQVIESIVDT